MRSPLWALCRWRQHGLMVAISSRTSRPLGSCASQRGPRTRRAGWFEHTKKSYSIFDCMLNVSRRTFLNESMSACRAPGNLQSISAREFINEHISHSLGKSLIEIQELNFYKDGEATPFGDVVGSEAFNWTVPLLWEQVKESVDYYARKASVELFNKSNRYRKRGVCMVPTKYGIGVSSAENRLQVLHHILQLPRRTLYAHKTLLRELWFDQPSRRNTPSVR
jgi:xanthine dehydrogenase molybdopterin-binding subunit B